MDTNKTAHKLLGCWALGPSVACFVCLLGEVAAFCAVRVGVKRTPFYGGAGQYSSRLLSDAHGVLAEGACIHGGVSIEPPGRFH